MTVPIPSLKDMAAAVRAGSMRAEALADQALARARMDRCNAFTAILTERALSDACTVDRAVAEGHDPGPLAGVPFVVKNLFDVEGHVTIAGSRLNAGNPSAESDAALVAQLRAAGAVLIGTTNMDALAYGYTSENTDYGNVLNPLDPERTPGGSSGGSAAAVAAEIVPLALGTDTNGSVRVPASLCGICGFKPTFGALDRTGVYPFVPSLDHAGLFTTTMPDMLHVAAALGLPAPRQPGRVARLGGWFDRHAGQEARDAAKAAAALLGTDEVVDLPSAAIGRSAAFLITACEGGDGHRPALAAQPEMFDPIVRYRLLAGALLPAHWYLMAQKARARVITDFNAIFERFDILLLPATPVPAPRLDDPVVEIDGKRQPARTGLGLMAQPITLAGLPVCTVPHHAGDLPVGVQVVGAPGREDYVLSTALQLEQGGLGIDRMQPEPVETFVAGS